MTDEIDHYAVTCKTTRETRFVQVPQGRHPSQHGYPKAKFKAEQVHREPEEADVQDQGQLRHCEHTRARIDLEAMLNRMNRAEFLEYVVARATEGALAAVAGTIKQGVK